MIFWKNTLPPPAESIVKDSLQEMKADIHRKRMNERERILDIYRGRNVANHLSRYFLSTYRDVNGKDVAKSFINDEVPLAKQNIVTRAIRKRSLVYKNQPDYAYGKDGKAEPDEKYNETYRWRKMKQLERETNAVGTMAMRIGVRNDMMDYDLIWDFMPIFDTDPLVPSAIVYPLSQPKNIMSDKLTEEVLVYWDSEKHYLIDSSGLRKAPAEDNPEMLNPYGMLPIIFAHCQMPDDDFWVDGYGGPLCNANDAINITLTEMRLGARFNLMGQPVITGVSHKDTFLGVGVTKAIQLEDPEADFKFATPTANMTSAIEYCKFEIENALQNMGLMVQWGDSADKPSGESLKTLNIEQLEVREDDVAVWLDVDNNTYEVERVVWEKKKLGKKLPQERMVNFSEIEFPLSPEQEQARAEWRWKHGFESKADYLMNENPDGFKDREAAEKFIADNIQSSRATEPQQRPRINLLANPTEQK